MSDKINIEELFRSMARQKVLVIGDIMIDAYLSGTVERISPEAPVPVVSLRERVNRPGGAANVAMNLQALGAKTFLCSVTGIDSGSEELSGLLMNNNINTDGIVSDFSRPTTKKFRIIGNNNHMLRVDEESTHDIADEIEEELIRRIDYMIDIKEPSLVVLQDYNKGVLTNRVIRHCIDKCMSRGIVVAVDPKKKNFETFAGATIFKPNLKEFSEGVNKQISSDNITLLKSSIIEFQKEKEINMMLVTLSENGICYSEHKEKDDFIFDHYKAEIREISDVSGAGDTVISVAALAYSASGNAAIATQLSNLAGGLVCEYSGVVSVNKDELFREFERYLETKK